MITVSILINGQPIITRSARNTGKVDCDGKHIYNVDDGGWISHDRSDGAVVLAIEMLKLVREI